MSDSFFVDTNLLVYTWDANDLAKQRRAASWMSYLWKSRRGRLSWQVLGEFYVVVTGKLQPGLTRSSARAELLALAGWSPVVVDRSVVEGAFAVQDRFGFSWWDALIVSAARAAGCSVLLTEDLQDGQDLDGLAVWSPFTHAPPDPTPGTGC